MEMKVSSQGGQANQGAMYAVAEVKGAVTPNKVQPVSAKDKGYREEDLAKSVDKLNEFLVGDNLEASYEKHEVFGDIMIKIINKDTKEVVLEVPPKKILDLIANMCKIAGVMVDGEA